MSKAPSVSSLRRVFQSVVNYRPLKFEASYEREVFFIASLGITCFYITALASFSPLDPSPIAVSYPTSVPTNMAGNIGASISGMALFAMGIAAWFLPLPFLTSAMLVLRKSQYVAGKARITGWILALLSIAALAASQFQNLSISGFELPAGGIVGNYIANQFTIWLGKTGSMISISTIVICSIMLICRRSLIGPMAEASKAGLSGNLKKPLWWDNFLHHRAEKAQRRADQKSQRLALKQAIASHEPRISDESRSVIESHHVDYSNSGPVVEEDQNSLIAPALGLFPEIPNDPVVPPKANKRLPVKTYSDYTPPPVSIFNKTEAGTTHLSRKELENTASLLIRTFEDFGLKGKIIGYQPGPVVTVFEYQPLAGIKQSKILGLIDDIALALKVDSIFIHPVRGKRALGVQVPNTYRETVHLGDIIDSQEFHDAESPLTFAMGKTLNGTPLCSDLATMPHLLAAGATGSGKSVAVNAMLCSIIMKASPDEVKMILVDPKMLELSVYEGIPHLLMPVITEPAKASLVLQWCVNEMERRYRMMQQAQVRNISGFNEYWAKASNDQKQVLRDEVGDDTIGHLPFIMLVIDELADLMMTAPKDVESSIQRLAQKARASGIHMILATQRPSVDIITGVIKANLPCRIAFQVVSKHDSRTILDLIGADKLLGKGDMLLQKPGVGRLERIQGALITDEEVINLVAAVKSQTKAEYDENIMLWIDDELSRKNETSKDGSAPSMDDDPKYDMAITIAQQHGVVSASFLQRHLKIGYNRAARIVEFMESQGLIGKSDGAKPRKWLGPQGDYQV